MLLTTTKYLLISLALTTIASPFASAGHNVCASVDFDDQVCVYAGSFTYGSCDDLNGGESTTVAVQRTDYQTGSGSSAGVGAYCSSYGFEWEEFSYRGTDEGVSAHANLAPGAEAGFGWHAYSYESTWGSGEGCGMTAFAAGVEVRAPCHAGTPPRVPALLP